MKLFGFVRKNKKNDWNEMIKTFGNPGIWYYVKKDYYDRAIAYLDTELNQLHDQRKQLERLLNLFIKTLNSKMKLHNVITQKNCLKKMIL